MGHLQRATLPAQPVHTQVCPQGEAAHVATSTWQTRQLDSGSSVWHAASAVSQYCRVVGLAMSLNMTSCLSAFERRACAAAACRRHSGRWLTGDGSCATDILKILLVYSRHSRHRASRFRSTLCAQIPHKHKWPHGAKACVLLLIRQTAQVSTPRRELTPRADISPRAWHDASWT